MIVPSVSSLCEQIATTASVGETTMTQISAIERLMATGRVAISRREQRGTTLQ